MRLKIMIDADYIAEPKDREKDEGTHPTAIQMSVTSTYHVREETNPFHGYEAVIAGT